MKSVIAIAAVLVATSAPWASAQTAAAGSGSQSIADVAKAEEARRQGVKKPAKVYTNGDLRPDIYKGVAPPPTPGTPANPTNTSPSNTTPGAPGSTPKPDAAGQKDQAYWADRMKTAQEQVARTQIFMDSLQSRINALMTDFVNRDDPAQRAKIEGDRKAALAEFEKVKKELEAQTKAIKELEDEARRAGVPPGWLRPGA